MNKLGLANLPISTSAPNDYERVLLVKLTEILDAHRRLINGLIDKTTTLPIYANNAAAITGGLAAGDLYRTGADPDPVMIVH